MLKKIKIAIIIFGVLLQMLVVVLFGFINTSISLYTYLIVFLVCCFIIHHFLGSISTT